MLLKRAWHYVITEPFLWLFYCFFQPARFRREFERNSSLNRIFPLFKLALPMFIISFPLALIIWLILYKVFPVFDLTSVSTREIFGSTSEIVLFLVATVWATLLGIVLGIVWGVGSGIRSGIVISISGGVASGIIWPILWSGIGVITGSITLSITGSVAGGIAGSITGRFTSKTFENIIERITRDISGNTIRRIAAGTVRLIGCGIIGGIVGAIASSVALGVLVVIVGSTGDFLRGLMWGGFFGSAAAIVTYILYDLWDILDKNVEVSIPWGFAGSIALGILAGIMAGIGASIQIVVTRSISIGNRFGFSGDIAVGITVGLAFGLARGISRNRLRSVAEVVTRTIVIAICLAIVGFITLTIIGNITGSIAGGIAGGIAFIFGYILGYFRIPLYPVSGFSGLKAYLSSRKNPPQVFAYLHHSALYWDECVNIPLPRLKQSLLIAAEQNVEQALEEIAFIVAERPQQIGQARAASLEIAVRDLETRNILRDIAHASQRLTEILPQEMGLIDPRWVTPFARLNDVSRDAARYYSPLGWQARRDALESMLTHLKKVHPNTAFGDTTLNKRLSEVVSTWRIVIQQELKELEKAPEKTSQIGNPYNPGPALELKDSLFVGRRDLAQHLGEALSRTTRRPTFLLNGERRMGKSSTLKQLPDLLGAHYLPITYDLQIRGISSSTAAFLGAIAEEIYKVMTTRGLRIKKLEYERLQEASQKNEAAVYYLFDEWLKRIEYVLEHEDRTLLLAFDEFEKLEEAGQDGYLNLRLLLDWFRSVIQNRPRLALLFSGTRTFGDLGTKWAGYFVNVQTLKVSFLQPAEARQLITQPVTDFPSEQVYGEGVIEEIMRVTGCHPFLVQAVCSALMDHLNVEKCNQAKITDVETAVSRVLKSWWNTYFRDLWERTDDHQRACLIAVRAIGVGNSLQIAMNSGLEEKAAHRSLEILLDRDLVLIENSNYRIATPIYNEWVERSSYI